MTSNRVEGAHSCSPRSTQRIAAICSSDSADRLAKVRLRTRLPSRNDSRSRYVGRASRFGTASMCMGAYYTTHTAVQPRMHGYIKHPPKTPMPLNPLNNSTLFDGNNEGT